MNTELQYHIDVVDMWLKDKSPEYSVVALMEAEKHWGEVKRLMEAQRKELIEQLEVVTKELTMQIALRFNDIDINAIQAGNPIVSKAIETIDKHI